MYQQDSLVRALYKVLHRPVQQDLGKAKFHFMYYDNLGIKIIPQKHYCLRFYIIN